jgi:hypothetical protein
MTCRHVIRTCSKVPVDSLQEKLESYRCSVESKLGGIYAAFTAAFHK